MALVSSQETQPSQRNTGKYTYKHTLSLIYTCKETLTLQNVCLLFVSDSLI